MMQPEGNSLVRPNLSRRARACDALAAIALAIASFAMPARAQTMFQWPDTSAQVSHYANMEDCLAADDRVKRSVVRREELTVWRDTIPINPRQALEPEPADVGKTASQCAARFVEPNVDIRDFAPALTLFLAAGRDSDAAALVSRRVAAPAKNARDRGIVVDSAVEIYLNARPARLDAAENLLLHRIRTSTDRVERLKTYATHLDAGCRRHGAIEARGAVDREHRGLAHARRSAVGGIRAPRGGEWWPALHL